MSKDKRVEIFKEIGRLERKISETKRKCSRECDIIGSKIDELFEKVKRIGGKERKFKVNNDVIIVKKDGNMTRLRNFPNSAFRKSDV